MDKDKKLVKDFSLLEKAFGSAKGAGPFKRDQKDRVF